MNSRDHKHTWKSALALLLALLLALSCCGCGAAQGKEPASSAEEVSDNEPAAEEEVSADELTAEAEETSDDESAAAAYEFPEDELAAAAEEHSLHLDGVSNAWQLGGYVTEDGRAVRDNVLMRSGNLYTATDEDIQKLSEEYHVTAIVDFRDAGEINMKPDREVPGAENINISLSDSAMGGMAASSEPPEEPDDMGGPDAQSEPDAQNEPDVSSEPGASGEPASGEGGAVRPPVGGAVPDMYTRMFVRDATLNGFRAFIDLLLEQDEDSVILYHCSSGKDRTGTATLILLTLLGVDEETVLRDFAMTNVFLADDIEAAVEEARQKTDDEEELKQVAWDTGVSVEYMALAFEQGKEECGTMLDYIKQQFHVTDEEIARLRELYLTD